MDIDQKKYNIIVIVIISVLVALSIACGVYYFVLKENMNKQKEPNNNLPNQEEVSNSNVNNEGMILYNKFQDARIVQELFYEKEKTTVNDLTNTQKLSFAYYYLENNKKQTILSQEYSTQEYITEEQYLMDSYYELFGTATNYNFEPFGVCPKISKSDDTSKIIISYTCGIDPFYKSEQFKKVTKIEGTNDKIYVYELVGFLEAIDYDDASNGKKLYSDIKRTNLVASGIDVDNYDLTDYQEQLPTYKYTFQKEDNNYYFNSIEIVK